MTVPVCEHGVPLTAGGFLIRCPLCVGSKSDTPPGYNPDGFWFEETRRGEHEVLIVNKGAEPKGSIEVDSYAEKLAWLNILVVVNSQLKR